MIKIRITIILLLTSFGFHSFAADAKLTQAETIAAHEKAFVAGDLKAGWDLGLSYYYGDYGKPDYQKAAKIFEQLAEKDHYSAQDKLGFMFYDGLEIDQNYPKAFKWLSVSATKGSRLAAYRVANMIENGQGTDKNQNAALDLYKALAEKGNYEAMSRLGHVYYNGIHLPKNIKKAEQWLRKAAALYDYSANHTLGKMHEKGEIGIADKVLAAVYYGFGTHSAIDSEREFLKNFKSSMTPTQVDIATEFSIRIGRQNRKAYAAYADQSGAFKKFLTEYTKDWSPFLKKALDITPADDK